MAVQDILLEDSFDLAIADGDFIVGESDIQHLVLIVELFTGSLKQFPLQGVGILKYSGSNGQAATIQREIKVKAEADGYNKATIKVTLQQDSNGTFNYGVNAERT